MLFTIIDVYEVMRTDDIYADYSKNRRNILPVCTNPYEYL